MPCTRRVWRRCTRSPWESEALQEGWDVIARTTWGRGLAVWLSLGVAHLATPVASAAGTGHVVDTSQVARRLVEQARTREERVKLFQDALGTRPARERAVALGADPDRLRAAIPHLTDRELAELSARATKVKDVAAGHYGGGPEGAIVLLGVLLIVAGVIAIVAVSDGYYDDDWDDCWCY